VLLAPVSMWLGLGCAGDNHTAAPPDPLLGTSGVQPAAPGAATPKPAAGTGSAALPALPAPNAVTSPAALAGGGPRPIDATHELRIATTTGTPGGAAWVGPASSGGGVPAQPMSRGADAAPATGLVLSGGTVRNETFEQLQAQLVARGIAWQRLECVDGEWHFSCSVPNRQNPNLNHTYEARAHDGTAAIRAVLDQIDREQR
jgi:hypothetical protein